MVNMPQAKFLKKIDFFVSMTMDKISTMMLDQEGLRRNSLRKFSIFCCEFWLLLLNNALFFSNQIS